MTTTLLYRQFKEKKF